MRACTIVTHHHAPLLPPAAWCLDRTACLPRLRLPDRIWIRCLLVCLPRHAFAFTRLPFAHAARIAFPPAFSRGCCAGAFCAHLCVLAVTYRYRGLFPLHRAPLRAAAHCVLPACLPFHVAVTAFHRYLHYAAVLRCVALPRLFFCLRFVTFAASLPIPLRSHTLRVCSFTASLRSRTARFALHAADATFYTHRCCRSRFVVHVSAVIVVR